MQFLLVALLLISTTETYTLSQKETVPCVETLRLRDFEGVPKEDETTGLVTAAFFKPFVNLALFVKEDGDLTSAVAGFLPFGVDNFLPLDNLLPLESGVADCDLVGFLLEQEDSGRGRFLLP